MNIGYIMSTNDTITLNEGKRTVELEVTSTCDRPIQVGSHFHFFEVNRLLRFDRQAAFGFRLDIPSGTSVRFEPGETKTVRLVELGGRGAVYGLNALTGGPTGEKNRKDALARAQERGFLTTEGEAE